MASASVARHIAWASLVAALVVSPGCAGKKKAVQAPQPEPKAVAQAQTEPTAAKEQTRKPSLLSRLKPFRKRQATVERAESPLPDIAGPSSPESAGPPSPVTSAPKEEENVGALARFNLFRKRRAAAKEVESTQTTPAESEDEQAKIKRAKPGFFRRLFRRGPKAIPEVTPEEIQRRTALTAKGEVSPPPFEHNGLKLSIGETSKARIIAIYGEPEHIFFSEGSEEILIYRRIRKIDSLYIFLDSRGLVKDYIITKEQ
jgi:hypothetical protein